MFSENIFTSNWFGIEALYRGLYVFVFIERLVRVALFGVLCAGCDVDVLFTVLVVSALETVPGS